MSGGAAPVLGRERVSGAGGCSSGQGERCGQHVDDATGTWDDGPGHRPQPRGERRQPVGPNRGSARGPRECGSLAAGSQAVGIGRQPVSWGSPAKSLPARAPRLPLVVEVKKIVKYNFHTKKVPFPGGVDPWKVSGSAIPTAAAQAVRHERAGGRHGPAGPGAAGDQKRRPRGRGAVTPAPARGWGKGPCSRCRGAGWAGARRCTFPCPRLHRPRGRQGPIDGEQGPGRPQPQRPAPLAPRPAPRAAASPAPCSGVGKTLSVLRQGVWGVFGPGNNRGQ